MDERTLQIVLKARDDASHVIRRVGAEAESGLQKIGSGFGSLVKSSTAGSVALAGALTLTGKSILNVASDMEQAKIAFTTFLGSSEAASKSLKELSDFAKVTPFTFPTVTEAARRLLAYNVQAKDLIPTLRMLGDISSGVGTEKLPQLILAFGQVKAATRLTGMELRQFSEAGVPLLQALVDQANKTGKTFVTVGGQSKEAAKELEKKGKAAVKATASLGELNQQLAIASQRLKEKSANSKTAESTLMSLRNQVENYQEKIAKANQTIGDFNSANSKSTGELKRVAVQTKVTAAQMQEMISDGQVSFDMVQQALAGMTKEGGRFFNLMEKQSQTFKGRMSNISDQLVRVALNIAGISTEAHNFGTVIKGSAFDRFSQAAQKVLDVLNDLEPKVKGLIEAFLGNKETIGVALGILAGGLLGAAVAMWAFLGPVVILATAFGAAGFAIGQLIANFDQIKAKLSGLAPVIHFVSAAFDVIRDVALKVYATFKSLFEQISDVVVNVFKAQMGPSLKELQESFNRLWQAIQPLMPLFKLLGLLLAGFVVGAILIVAGALTGLVEAFASMIPFLILWIAGFISYITGFFQVIVGLFTFNGDLIKTGVQNMWEGIKNAFLGMGGMVLAIVGGFIDGVIRFFTTLYNKLVGKSIVPDIVNGIVAWFGKLPGLVGSILSLLGKEFVSYLNGIWSTVSGWKDKVVGAFDSVRDAVQGAINAMRQAVKAGVKNAGNVMSFQTGGFVPKTGMAMVHQGEFVMSRGMLNGNAPIPASVTREFNAPITIQNVVVNDGSDVNSLGERLAYLLSTSGAL